MDGVEIKVTVGPAVMARAIETLGLDPATAVRRRIWFCEVPAGGPGGKGPVLLEQRVILRLRETQGKGADSTVKFRPFDPSSLAARWRRHGDHSDDLRIEGDWVGARHVVSASLVADQGDDEPAEAAAGRRPLTKLFTAEQESFLQDHAEPPVDLDALEAFGPIAALKWEQNDRALSDLTAELWRVDQLEFLELSVRTDDVADAADFQRHFEAALDERGLLDGAVQETKTRTVLEHLLHRR